LDLVFAGIPTDPLNTLVGTLDLFFTRPLYEIAEAYSVWEIPVGMVAKTFSQIITFTRASSATYFDATGTLQTATTDVPRFDYDPFTLAAQGFLIEESRTNGVRNNTMQGAVAGTPGTNPTNWSVGTTADGLTKEIVGSGISGGINYIDIRWYGTSGAGATTTLAAFEANAQIAALNAQTWAGSAFIALVGGTLTNVSLLELRIRYNDSGGAILQPAGISLASATATMQRFSIAQTATDASTAFVNLGVIANFTNSAAVDFTLRIGLPQLEQGAFATSVIETTTAAVTRSADVASVNTLSPWFNAAAGTVYAEVQRYALIASTTFATAWALSDNTANERFLVYNTESGQRMVAVITDGGSAQATLSAPNAITANTTVKTALAYAVNDFAFVRDAGAVQTDTSGTLPTVDRLYIGANAVGGNQWTGYIRRITYYPRKLSSAELQTLTT
jgi:hypothetical protein